MATEAEKQMVVERLKAWLETLPEVERELPFTRIMVAGQEVSLSPAQMLLEVLEGTELGDEIIEAEMRKLEYYERLR